MADVKKIATRESYGHALEELGAEYPQIVVLDADLKASTRTEYFAAKYPDRFYDCGIAEGNMMAVFCMSRDPDFSSPTDASGE